MDLNTTAALMAKSPSSTKPAELRTLQPRPGPWFQALDAAGFEWNTFQLPLANLPPAHSGLRIIHLSDFHCRKKWQRAYDDLLARLAASPPDLILFTGDMVDSKRNPGPALPTARKLAKGFNARLGVFGIRGNHDRRLWASSYFGTPMQLIDGQRRLVGNAGAMLELIGAPSSNRDDLTDDFISSLPAPSPGVPRIVLSHFPDHVLRFENQHPDLFLCGHTHGGQICPRRGRPLLRHDSLPASLCTGIHRVGKSWLVVNRGFGFSSIAIRIFCPAEVIELVLTPQS